MTVPKHKALAEPRVPSRVAHRHMQRWQRRGVKLPGQCTLARKSVADSREDEGQNSEHQWGSGARLDDMVNASESLQTSSLLTSQRTGAQACARFCRGHCQGRWRASHGSVRRTMTPRRSLRARCLMPWLAIAACRRSGRRFEYAPQDGVGHRVRVETPDGTQCSHDIINANFSHELFGLLRVVMVTSPRQFPADSSVSRKVNSSCGLR
jgi:hypothetical protein